MFNEVGLENDMTKQIKGQMSILHMLNGFNNEEVSGEEISIRNEKEEFSIPDEIEQRMKSIKEFSRADCEKCDCAFGSRKCFQNRGYQFDIYGHFIKGEDGKQLRRLVELNA